MNKLEKAVFYLLIFSIPLQTRVFLYSVGAVEGFNEWQSVFLYGTDILIFALFVFWFVRTARTRKLRNLPPTQTLHSKEMYTPSARDTSGITFRLRRNSSSGFLSRLASYISAFRFETVSTWKIASFKKLRVTGYGLLVTMLFFVGISIFFAPYWEIGIYRFLKLLMFAGLFFYVSKQKFKFKDFAFPFALAGVFQGIIAIGQFLQQKSLGLKWLGESPLAAGREEVAEMVAFGARFMRSYGTLPSPNVLAAFLALAIFVLLTWYFYDKKLQKGRNFIFVGAGLSVMGLAFLFTFSRSVLAVFAPLFILYFVAIFTFKNLKSFRKSATRVALPVGVGILTFGLMYFPEIYARFMINIFEMRDLAIAERGFLSYTAKEFISNNFLGVGWGNFTMYFREVFGGLRESLYQPVHNIFILIAVEAGITSVVFFGLFLAKLLYDNIKKLWRAKAVILPLFSVISILFLIFTGLFDHYYLTLQQGGLMFWIILGIAHKSVRDNL